VNTTKITIVATLVLVIGGCSTAKKNIESSSSTTPVPNTPTTSIPSLLLPRPAGIPAPGEEELNAIHVKYRRNTRAVKDRLCNLYPGSMYWLSWCCKYL